VREQESMDETICCRFGIANNVCFGIRASKRFSFMLFLMQFYRKQGKENPKTSGLNGLNWNFGMHSDF
jgi:hypothetical protein